MSDMTSNVSDKIKESKLFDEVCSIHKITFDNRFGCHMCEDGEPSYDEKIEELFSKGYLVVL